MNPVIDAFLDCGVNCFYPCEPAAGMDIVALREKYGKRIYFKGGIDKHVLRKDFAAIRRELNTRCPRPCWEAGRFLPLTIGFPMVFPLKITAIM